MGKVDSLSKDLDDLVSLYEIVSEQMNPFVGLSKVTKKRIDALENFTKEIEDLKSRLDIIEEGTENGMFEKKTYSYDQNKIEEKNDKKEVK
jgi:archaellum component FlaC